MLTAHDPLLSSMLALRICYAFCLIQLGSSMGVTQHRLTAPAGTNPSMLEAQIFQYEVYTPKQEATRSVVGAQSPGSHLLTRRPACLFQPLCPLGQPDATIATRTDATFGIQCASFLVQ